MSQSEITPARPAALAKLEKLEDEQASGSEKAVHVGCKTAVVGGTRVPEVSRFFGIVIRMYFDDHNPPHFHAIYAGNETQVGIDPIVAPRGACRAVRRPW